MWELLRARVPAKSLGDAEQAHSTVCGSTADGMAGSVIGREAGSVGRSRGRAVNAQKKGVAAAEVVSMDLSGMRFGRVMAVRLLIESGGDFAAAPVL